MDVPSNLSTAQSLFWTGQKLEPDCPLYNMAVNIAINGVIDPARFERALRRIVAKCDALMSVFEEVSAQPHRVVCWNQEWALDQLDLTGEEDPNAVAQTWASERSQRIFDLDRLLFDSALLKIGADRYIWYLNQHHLITDAWSTSLLFREVSAAYEDEAYEPQLPSFADYVAFERAARQSSDFEQVAEKWRQKIGQGITPPRMHGSSSVGLTTRSERMRIDIGHYRSERLRSVATEDDVRCLTPHLSQFTIFVTLLFAYLYRISGQRSLAIGAPAHNRPTLQSKKTLGVFIELYPVFTAIAEAETFQSLLEKVKMETAEFLRNAKPGSCNPELNRCFNTVLNYINASFGKFAGLTTETDWLHTGHSDRGHDLRLLVYDFDQSGEFVLEFDANTAVFGEELRAKIPEHFLQLVDAFLHDRACRIEAVELLSDGEQRRLQQLGTGENWDNFPGETLSKAILGRATQAPNRVAITAADGTMTYAELELASRKVAGHLVEQAVATGSIIPIVGTASCAWLAGLVGILRHGSAYLPVDPMTPPERCRRMIDESHSKIVLVSGVESFPSGIEVTPTDISEIIRSESKLSLTSTHDNSSVESLAYVLFTSGSTGEPKGVCVPHRAVLNLIADNERRVPLSGPLNCAIWTNVGFDVSVYEVFTALAYGHTLCVPPANVRFDGELLFGYWGENRIASGYLPPFLLPQLDQWLDGESLFAERILVGVESIPYQLLGSIARKRPELKIINGYGPTEAAVCTTFFLVSGDDVISGMDGPTPVGRPLSNCGCWILDHDGKQCPVGAVGELWISGDGLATGYLNDPVLTDERFREVDIGGKSIRAYRTGDAMKYGPNGQLHFVGRLDDQVKIRGVRIEPAEIQLAVVAHTGINQCAVKCVGGGERQPCTELAAFFVSRATIDVAELRRDLRQRLPDAMVPAHLIQVDTIPRTRNGKIDFAALPDPLANSDVAGVALPDGPVEEIIAGIFAELLGRDEIAVDRHFLELGGDSLFAMRALGRICREFDVDLPLHIAFRHSSVRELAGVVAAELLAEIEALDEGEAERLVNER